MEKYFTNLDFPEICRGFPLQSPPFGVAKRRLSLCPKIFDFTRKFSILEQETIHLRDLPLALLQPLRFLAAVGVV